MSTGCSANRIAHGPGGGERWHVVAKADGELEAGGGALVVCGGGESAASGAYTLYRVELAGKRLDTRLRELKEALA